MAKQELAHLCNTPYRVLHGEPNPDCGDYVSNAQLASRS